MSSPTTKELKEILKELANTEIDEQQGLNRK